MRDPDLWQRIRQEPVLLGPQKVAAETLLPRNYNCSRMSAQALTAEYRRYLYLVAVAGEVLAPLRAVDQLWHLYLADDEVWRDYSDRAIGRNLRHITGRPTPHRDPAYLRTLDWIEAEFGAPAPERYWPRPDDPAQGWRRPLLALAAGLALALLFTIGVSQAAGIGTGLAALLMAIMVWTMQQPFSLSRRGSGGGGGCGGASDGGGGCGGGGD